MTDFDFERLACEGFTRIPVLAEARADLHTPLALYAQLASGPYSCLLESVVGGERFGRYSLIGLPCAERIEARGSVIRRLRRDSHGREAVLETCEGDPFEYARVWLAARRTALAALPLPFSGGLVGYFGYETVRHIEPAALGAPKPDPLGTPDMTLLVSDELAVIDNVRGKLYFIVHADPREPRARERAHERIADLESRLRLPLPDELLRPSSATQRGAAPECSFTEEEFLRSVGRVKELILAGEVMQVQISQRTTRAFDAPPFELYRALRSVNPSPYMFYLDCGDHQVVGASPEILLRCAGDKVTLRPIAGTRPRGGTPAEDERLAAELLADPKERAEHVMLIDLGRNDVGRVSAGGSVRVTETMGIERYSHVMHIVSNVEGRLRPGLDAIDALKAGFPAGTVTGAPKVRAMQIIDELEPLKRGIYAGGVGTLGFDGGMDLAIAIRTAVIKSGALHVQAAAGIVADSDPRAEWLETRHKARALLRAADIAEARRAREPA